MKDWYRESWKATPDYAQARRLFEQVIRSTGKGDAETRAKAKESMGLLYLNGLGVPKNRATAQKYFRQAYKQGSQDACLRLH